MSMKDLESFSGIALQKGPKLDPTHFFVQNASKVQISSTTQRKPYSIRPIIQSLKLTAMFVVVCGGMEMVMVLFRCWKHFITT